MASTSRLETLIRQLQGLLGGAAWRGAGVTVTFPGGSQTSNAQTVTHGLGRAPTSITFGPIATTTPVDPFVVGGTITDTVFDVKCRTTDGSSPAAASTVTFYWMSKG